MGPLGPAAPLRPRSQVGVPGTAIWERPVFDGRTWYTHLGKRAPEGQLAQGAPLEQEEALLEVHWAILSILGPAAPLRPRSQVGVPGTEPIPPPPTS